jgi:DNA-binding CsgD family transcriptional regulator
MADLADANRPRHIAICVTDRTIAQAAGFVMSGQAGWQTCENPSTADVVLTGTEPPRAAAVGRHLLVVAPSPARCRQAMTAFLDGAVQAVVTADELDQLPAALDAMDRGLGAVSRTAIARARAMPPLTTRQERVLRGVLAAQANRAIAHQLNVSEATVKREVGDLLRLFRTSGRLALARAASDAGFDVSANGRR